MLLGDVLVKQLP